MAAQSEAPALKGYFITFEGGEGSGKTTQIMRLAARLRAAGHRVLTTREPGGSPGAEALRHVILSGAAEAFGTEMEAILFAAARMDHVTSVIRPALSEGAIVISDRFHDSTRVYQGLSGHVGSRTLKVLERAALCGLYPDLTLILDVGAEEGLRRAAERRGAADADRFEKEAAETHEARRKAFLAIAEDEPGRCIVIEAGQPADAVAERIAAVVGERLRAAGLGELEHRADPEAMPASLTAP